MGVLPLLLFFSAFSTSSGYKHVIFMHGLLTGKSEVKDFQIFIDKYHPGTNVSYIDDFQHASSLLPLPIQLPVIRRKMAAIMAEHTDGIHIICFSQGGLICRGVVETLNTHNVINFISLSSPQAGQYGDTAYLAKLIPGFWLKDMYKLFYTKKGQAWTSIANFWNDPYQQSLYKNWSSYLAVLNNQSTTHDNFTSEFRSNFLKLKNLILVGGPDDGVITPWQSSHFGTYNETEGIKDFQQQDFYINDWFGLRTLHQRHSLYVYSVPGVNHTSWHRNSTVFLECIEPWLT